MEASRIPSLLNSFDAFEEEGRIMRHDIVSVGLLYEKLQTKYIPTFYCMYVSLKMLFPFEAR